MSERFAAGSGEDIRVEREGSVATLVVDRPAQRNALSIPVCERMHEIMDGIERDPGIRVLVVTGTGPKSFVAGADINELVAYTPALAYRHIEVGHTLFTRIENLHVPTIAAVNGYCLGGGLEIAMACDIRIASANAKFGLPEMNIGMVPGWGGTERLQRLIGQSRAAAMMLTGEMITSDEALANGLVYRLFDSVDALRAGTDELAAKLAGFAPLTMRATKEMIGMSAGLSPQQVLQRDAAMLAFLLTTTDAREGLTAFLEKRPARYTGE
ncbi:enoyl-CoA hydratase-related protein [Brooklawnia cerclae]|uniref:Enoyl-CoA hydratase n=1 Tax=Brooklawnia cerclae TaxID=349934 RepID=A0ABX0SNX9_9ACTN|nr:enoyl-CoA hydratase [Brooklawnia cerclae]